MESLQDCYASRTAMLSASTGEEKSEHRQLYLDKRQRIDKRWFGLIFDDRNHRARMWH